MKTSKKLADLFTPPNKIKIYTEEEAKELKNFAKDEANKDDNNEEEEKKQTGKQMTL